MLETYPFDHPKMNNRSMNMKSEDMTGADDVPEPPRWTLHIKKMGMNSVLAIEIAKSCLPDHIVNSGNEQT